MKSYDELLDSILETRAKNAIAISILNKNQPEIDALNKRLDENFAEMRRLDEQHEIEKISMPHNHLHLRYKYGRKMSGVSQRRNRLKKRLKTLT